MNTLKYIKIRKLANKAKNGDKQAFSELYSLTYKNIYFVAIDILKDSNIAEDAAQEIFIVALKHINRLENSKLFLAWINKIAYNYCINEAYKVQRIKEIDIECVEEAFVENKNDPLEVIINNENKAELINLIHMLPTIYSNIIMMRYFEDMKISDIASSENLSEGTVKSRLSNSRSRLQKLGYKANLRFFQIF